MTSASRMMNYRSTAWHTTMNDCHGSRDTHGHGQILKCIIRSILSRSGKSVLSILRSTGEDVSPLKKRDLNGAL